MRRAVLFIRLVVTLAGLVTLAAGCARPKAEGNDSQKKALTAVALKHTAPAIDYARIHPNEVGDIPVIMYHDIGGKLNPRDPNMVRPVASFKKDLELLYAARFRPVNLSDVLNNNINIPAGLSPVVLTFDDGRMTQFRLIETDKAQKIDPNCAMGILDAFHKRHPDWQMRATFFILPKSEKTLEPFGQPGLGDQKLAYLLDSGMELGNHTVHHPNMRHMNPQQIQAEIGGANNAILAAAPKARLQVVALPMGLYPAKKYWNYLVKGSYQGRSYEYKGAMMAAWRPIPSPASKKFNPMRLERIGPADVTNGLRYWIRTLKQGGRYVSDGDPNVISVPRGSEKLVNVAKLKAQNKIVHAYSPFGGPGGAKPILGAEAGEGAKARTAPAPAASVPTVVEKPAAGG